LLEWRLVMEGDQLEKLVKENNELIQKNNELLKKVYSYIKWRRVFTALYWILIIGAVSGLLFFLEPYVNQLLDTYQAAREAIQNVGQ